MGLATLAATFVILVRLARLDARGCWLLAVLFVASGPLQYSVKEGNTSHIVLLALAGGLALARANRSVAAGAALAAAAIVKPPLLLFGGFFLMRGDLRGAAAFCGAITAAAGLSVAVFGWGENVFWFQTCILQFGHRWLGAFNVQSITGFLMRLEPGPPGLVDWNVYAPSAADRVVDFAAAGLLYAVAAAAWAAALLRPPAQRRPSGTDRLDFQYALVLALAVVSSPLSWSHYYCWFLVPTALFLGAAQDAAPLAWRWLGALAIALVTPLVWPFPLSGPAQEIYRMFLVSNLLFGGLLWFALTVWRLAGAGPDPRLPAIRPEIAPVPFRS